MLLRAENLAAQEEYIETDSDSLYNPPQEFHYTINQDVPADVPFSIMAATNDYDTDLGQYRIYFYIQVKERVYDCSSWTKLYVSYTDSDSEELFRQIFLDDINVDTWYTFTTTLDVPIGKTVKSFKFEGRRRWGRRCMQGKHESNNFSIFSYVYPGKQIHFPSDFEGADKAIGAYTSTIVATYQPYMIKLFRTDNNSNENCLLEENSITYKVNKNFQGGKFYWKYQIGSSGNEKVFPQANPGGSTLTFCGNDIASDYLQAIKEGKSITLWAVGYDGGYASSSVTIDVPKEAPRITSVLEKHPACANEHSGSVTIHLQRKIADDEKLYVAIQGQKTGYYNNTILGPGASYIEVNKLPADIYDVVFLSGTDKNGARPTYVGNPTYHRCTFELQNPPQLSITNIEAVAVHCYGGKDGKIQFLANGGSGDLYATYNGIQIPATRGQITEIRDLSAGKYLLQIFDTQGCSLKDSQGNNMEWTLNVEQPKLPMSIQLQSLAMPTGYGRNDGQINVIACNGTGYGYTFTCEKDGKPINGSNGIFMSLSAGKYRVWGTDGNYTLPSPPTDENIKGCRDYTDIVLTEPALLTGTISIKRKISCNGYADGELKAAANGGVGGYEYQWQMLNKDNWQNITERSPNCEMIDGLSAGNYRALIWDKNANHAVSEVFHLTEPAPYSIDFRNMQPLCHGGADGKIEAVVTGNNGDYTYQWQGTPITAPSISGKAGTYILKVTDKLGCTITKEVNLEEPPILQASFNIVKPSSAQTSDGSIIIIPTGGTPYSDGTYRYQWDYHLSTSNPLVNIPADSIPYHVVVKDAHNCKVELSPWVIYPLEVMVRLKDSISCHNRSDGVLEAIVQGGVGVNYRYDWYRVEGENLICVSNENLGKRLPSGTYRVQVTDKQEATAWSSDYKLNQPEQLVTHVEAEAVRCYGGNDGKIIASASGGTVPYRYLWTTGKRTPEISGLQAGRYLVMVTDSHGCLAEAVGEVESPEELKLEHDITGLLCKDNPAGIRLKMSGGTIPYTANWDDGFSGIQRDSLYAGTYSVIVTDKHGCQKEDTFILEEVEEVSVDLGEDVFLCQGQQKELKSISNWDIVSYQWFADGQPAGFSKTLNVNKAGVYRVEVMTKAGCPGNGEIRVYETNTEIGCNFAMASEIEKGNSLKIVNTSLPVPEYCEWIIPDLASVSINKEQEDLLELIIDQTGTYTIGLKSVSGACEMFLYKDVTVVKEGTGVPKTRSTERLISDIRVWPNPNRGYFRIRVNLEKVHSGLLRLYSSTGILLREIKCEGNDIYEYTFNEILPAGIYILHVLFGQERESVKIIIE